MATLLATPALTGAGVASAAELFALVAPEGAGAFPTVERINEAARYADALIGCDRAAAGQYVLPFGQAAAVSPGIHRADSRDAYYLDVTAGTIALAHKIERAYTAPTEYRDRPGVQLEFTLFEDDDADEDTPARVITHWSRRSRARMVRTLAELDHETWATRDPFAMVTLTLPGDWLTVAPTGRDFKRFLEKLRMRYVKATGLPWQAVWKLEFQRRGAPHFHLLMRPPALVKGERFELWLSRTWMEVVGHPDEGERERHEAAGTNVDFGYRATDPRRVAVYFLKHSSKTSDDKEYQHQVPAPWRVAGKGPGRFWGVAGLGSFRARVEVDARTFYTVRRVLRGLEKAARARTALSRRRHALDGSEAQRRASLTSLASYGLRGAKRLRSSSGGGWVVFNDAPAVLEHVVAWAWLNLPDDGGVQIGIHQRPE